VGLVTDSFADVLRRSRRASGLSQEALAESAGLSASAISALERGERRKPYPHTVRALAEAMDLSAQDREALRSAAQDRGSQTTSRDAAQSVVPAPLTSFVGREDLVALGTALITRERLITLTGLGGIGKSRLAVELGRRAAGLFAGRRWTVDVESLARDTPVDEAAAAVLGLRDSPGHDHVTSVARAMENSPSMLTLDGCEHRARECAELATSLLSACPGLVVLVTSQRPLRVPGEAVLAVPPLAVPVPGQVEPALTDAVRLFLARAQLAHPALELSETDLVAVAELCRQLDGIPLAIELAAARVRMLLVTEMIARMQDRFELLHAEGDLPARKRAIHTALEWSCDLLSPEERQLFGRLSVFVGGFSLQAVEAGPGRDMSHVLRLMTTLVDASLVAADTSRGTSGRFRLLDTVRAYASQLLSRTPDQDTVRLAHADYYRELAEIWEPELRSPDQAHVLRLLDDEYENMRAALHQCASCPEPEPLLRLVAALGPYWVRRGRFHEGQQWLRRAFEGNPPDAIPLSAYESASDLCWVNGDVATHRQAARRYLDQATAAGDVVHQARATLYVSSTYMVEGDRETWQVLAEKAMELAERGGDAWTVAMVLNDTAAGAVLDDVTAGRDLLIPAALRPLRDAVLLARSTGDLYLVALALDSLALVEARSGHHEAALEHWTECLVDLGDVIDPTTAATCIEGLAQLALLRADPERCLSLLAASAAHRARHDVAPSPIWAEIVATTSASAVTELPAEAIEAAARSGEDLVWADVVDLGLEGVGGVASA